MNAIGVMAGESAMTSTHYGTENRTFDALLLYLAVLIQVPNSVLVAGKLQCLLGNISICICYTCTVSKKF